MPGYSFTTFVMSFHVTGYFSFQYLMSQREGRQAFSFINWVMEIGSGGRQMARSQRGPSHTLHESMGDESTVLGHAEEDPLYLGSAFRPPSCSPSPLSFFPSLDCLRSTTETATNIQSDYCFPCTLASLILSARSLALSLLSVLGSTRSGILCY